MRFGWLAAAAAMVCAGPAGAQTFVEYEAQGTGTQTFYNIFQVGPTVRTGDVFFDFVAEVDPVAPYTLSYFSDGRTFLQPGPGTFTVNAALANQITVSSGGPIGQAPIISSTINYLSGSTPGYLPTSLLSDVATGSFGYTVGGPIAGTSVMGTISQFRILGTVDAYIAPNAFFAPEIGSWAMMILGFGAIGFALRRTRQGYVGTALNTSPV